MVPPDNAVQGIAPCPNFPEIAPIKEWSSPSSGSLSIIEGPAVNVWSETLAEGKTDGELKLQLQL